MLITLAALVLVHGAHAQTPNPCRTFTCGRISGSALQSQGLGDQDDIYEDLEIVAINAQTLRFTEHTYFPGSDELSTTTLLLNTDPDGRLTTGGQNGQPKIPVGQCVRGRCTWTIKGGSGTFRIYIFDFTGGGTSYTITEHDAARKIVWRRTAYLGS